MFGHHLQTVHSTERVGALWKDNRDSYAKKPARLEILLPTVYERKLIVWYANYHCPIGHRCYTILISDRCYCNRFG